VQFVAESPGLLLQEFLPYAVLVYCTPMMGRAAARPRDAAWRRPSQRVCVIWLLFTSLPAHDLTYSSTSCLANHDSNV
jgi:hypothetical protein